jgi:protein tyrosine/serine phosphatase
MNPVHRFRTFAVLAILCSANAAQPFAQGPKPEPAAVSAAQRAKLNGLPNFARISKQLLRGGQPNVAGFDELKKLGVHIVVNLGYETGEIARERAIVQSAGMQYVSIPWRGSKDPNPEQIAEFLELLRTNPDKQIFVHCQRGAERTGVMVACYRMSVDQWTSDQALNEMEQFGFRGLWFGHLKKFVRAFPSLLLNDPLLKKLRNTG